MTFHAAEKYDKQFWRAHILSLYAERRICANEAHQMMQIGRSQFFRLLARFRATGPSQFCNPVTRKSGNRGFGSQFKHRVIALICERYHDHGPTFVSELLDEAHGIKISPSTARRWMTEAGIWHPNLAGRRKIHQPRKRMKAYGQQIQIDGSPHAWFEDRGPKCCAMVFIDDATGKWQILRFFDVETGAAYVECATLYLQRYGRPTCFVTDRFSALRSIEGITEFEQGTSRLNVAHTKVNSPQSKGRVEKSHRTLQDRLVKYFRHAGINSIEQANKVADRFCIKFNKRFALPAPDGKDAHRPLPKNADLEVFFSRKEQRKLSTHLTFQYQGQRYLVPPNAKTSVLARHLVPIIERGDGVSIMLPDGSLISTTAI